MTRRIRMARDYLFDCQSLPELISGHGAEGDMNIVALILLTVTLACAVAVTVTRAEGSKQGESPSPTVTATPGATVTSTPSPSATLSPALTPAPTGTTIVTGECPPAWGRAARWSAGLCLAAPASPRAAPRTGGASASNGGHVAALVLVGVAFALAVGGGMVLLRSIRRS